MPVREYSGNAKSTTLVGTISATATSILLADAVGYPTGTTGPFVITVDAGAAAEEKVLCASRTGNTITVATGGRGWDGTTASDHDNGASIRHTYSATDAREANAHVNQTTGTPHGGAYLTPADGNAAYVRRDEIVNGTVTTTESTTSTVYTDLATVGASATATIGPSGRAIIIISGRVSNNTTGQTSHISVAGPGLVAGDTTALSNLADAANSLLIASHVFVAGGLTVGAGTFTLKYRVTGGTGSFSHRRLAVIPI
jgi:hypothetical protein